MTPESMPGLDRLSLPTAWSGSRGQAVAERKPSEDDRRRVVAWSDPLATLAQASRLSGLEHLQALRDGRLPAPPVAALMRIGLDDVAEGRAVVVADPGEDHYDQSGLVHGGLAATMLDSALGCAVQSTLPRGAAYSTIELTVNYVRPVTRDTGPLRAEGTVVHRGASIATAEGRIVAVRTGTLVAHGTTTVAVADLATAEPALRRAA